MRELRVLELAGDVTVASCGRLLASTGADVVLAEPAGGGPLRALAPWFTDAAGRQRSATHEYLHAGKRGVVLTPDDESFERAVSWADVVLSSCDGDVAAITALHRQVAAIDRSTVLTVLSGFGLTGPYAAWGHSPLVDWAAGGYLYLTGEPDREPLQGGGPWASYVAGVTGAIATAAAAMEAARTGQGQLVDVGVMEAVAAAHQWTITMYTHTGAVKRRWGTRFGEAFHPLSLFRCADDRWICVAAPSRDQWERFCITTDSVELMADESLYAPGVRFERADEIDRVTAAFFETYGADEAVTRFQANRVPAARVLDLVEVLRSEQPTRRGFWQPRDDIAAGACMPRVPFALGTVDVRPAPGVGADDEGFRDDLGRPRTRPLPRIDLTSVRLLEFGLAWAGPLAGRWLGDLGVDVVKVEHPASRGFRSGPLPDRDWHWGEYAPPSVRAEVFPDADPGEHRWNRMGLWNKMNRSKRSLALDAKAPGGAEALDRLIAHADLLFHNFTPRGARSLGIDPERLGELNPRLASVAMTGYGETGPMADHSSYGPILEAYGGFDEMTGYEDGGPMRIGIALPDAVGGLHGAYALLAALWERELAPDPVHVDLSQLETLLAFGGEALLATSVTGTPPVRRGNRSPDHAPQGVYPCVGHDAWVAITVRSDAEWRALVELLDDPVPASLATADRHVRARHHGALDAAIGAWTGRRTAREAASELQRRGIAACPAFTNQDLVEDPHLCDRGFLVEWDQPDVGLRRFPGFPVHFERTPITIRPAPTLGADNDAILRPLGYDADQLAALAASGTIASEPPP
jgi:crotonobetainyl-CoA:carnitine CoA-transferase CaiB-like acyl-CoA transferase